ncbi:MAG: hypothetical protein K8S98_14370 [Planctomycetes bacterium]|nr:hypothetical protein [Planctomycetota bacterium]
MRTLSIILLAAVAAVGIGALAVAQDRPSPKLTYDDLARQFIDEHCKKDTPIAECPFETILEKDYARFELGLFTVEYPASFLDDKQKADALRDLLVGMVELQAHWVDWLAPTDPKAEPIRQDLAAVRAWIKTWKAASLAAFQKGAEKDWLACLKAEPAIVDATKRLRESLFSAELLTLVPADGKAVRVVMCPTRLDFMQLLGYGGLVDENAKTTNWVASAPEWTQFWIVWTVCIALEYAPWEGNHPEFKTGMPMTKVGATGTLQHVVQQSTLALLRRCSPMVAESTFDRGLASEMTIQVCGEFSTIENAGSVYTSGGRTQPYERFVPGGNPKGGTLPPMRATSQSAIVENHWRKGRGTDHFLAPLREGQKSGAKEAKAKDPLPNFVLSGGSDGGKHIVHAPFFGPHAADQEYPPSTFVIDYAEFFRVYRTAFAYWLSTHGGATAPESKDKFAKLARQLASCTPERTLDQVFAEVYGIPLSAKDGSTDNLEWRFLKWIQNGK